MTISNMMGVEDIFDEAQRSFTNHRKLQIKLLKLYTGDEGAFLESFKTVIHQIMLVAKEEPCVGRIISLIKQCCDNNVKDTEAEEEGDENDANNSMDVSKPSKKKYNFGDEFNLTMLQYLLKFSQAGDKAVRLRMTQLLGVFLGGVFDSDVIDDRTWENIESALLSKTSDKLPAVRVNAVKSLHRLQSDEDPENDVVVQTMLRLLSNDNSKEVRKTVLKTMIVSKYTLPHIINRTRDCNEQVQLVAYQQISKLVHMKALQAQQRIRLITNGINSRNTKIQAAANDMLINTWLNKYKKKDILKLLKSLDVNRHKQGCTDVMNSIFENFDTISEEKDESILYFGIFSKQVMQASIKSSNEDEEEYCAIDDLTAEKVFYLRMLVAHLKKTNQADEELDKYLPSLTVLCTKVIQPLVEQINEIERRFRNPDHSEPEEMDLYSDEYNFMLNELIHVVKAMDFSFDESGKVQLIKLLTSLLSNVYVQELEDDTIKVCLSLLVSCYGDDESRNVSIINELISEVLDPLEPFLRPFRKGDTSKEALSGKLAELEEMKSDAQGHQETEQIEQQMEAITGELERLKVGATAEDTMVPWRLKRTLALTTALLSSTSKMSSVLSMYVNVLVPCRCLTTDLLNQCNDEEKADDLQTMLTGWHKTIALYSLLDLETAKKHYTFFCDLIMDEESETTEVVVGLEAIFDMLLLYGSAVVTSLSNPSERAACIKEIQLLSAEQRDQLQFEDNKAKLLELLKTGFRRSDSQLLRVTVLGVTKLLTMNRLLDCTLLQELVLTFFRHLDEGEGMDEDALFTSQCLSAFFQDFSESPTGRQLLSDSMVITVRAVVSRSELSRVNVEAVCKFFLNLLDGSSTHLNRFALDLCVELAAGLCFNEAPKLRLLSKSVNLISPALLESSTVGELNYLVKETIDSIDDKLSIRSLNKFHKAIKAAKPVALTAEQTEQLDTVIRERASEMTRVTSKRAVASSRRSRRILSVRSTKKVVDESDSSASEDAPPPTRTRARAKVVEESSDSSSESDSSVKDEDEGEASDDAAVEEKDESAAESLATTMEQMAISSKKATVTLTQQQRQLDALFDDDSDSSDSEASI